MWSLWRLINMLQVVWSKYPGKRKKRNLILVYVEYVETHQHVTGCMEQIPSAFHAETSSEEV